MASVRVEHLVREFAAGVRALDDVSLEVADGELLVLVGPSGCGKSTLLRIVAGLDTATSGRVFLADRDVSSLAPAERNVAMVFQDYALYPHMTVRRNLEFPLRVRRLAAADRDAAVARVASMLGLEPLMSRLPKELSGGQRQRVAMGRALVREPSVSLLDEPLSNLDARLRSEVRSEIAELQRRTGQTMIYVTHDQVEAMTLGHRVAVLDKGILQQVAPPAEIYDRPANAFVAGFIGSPPMNLIPVTIDGDVARVDGSALAVRLERQAAPGAAMLGFRPESAVVLPFDGDAGLPVVAEAVEDHGHELVVRAQLVGSGRTVLLRVARQQQVRPGDRLRIELPDLHVFA